MEPPKTCSQRNAFLYQRKEKGKPVTPGVRHPFLVGGRRSETLPQKEKIRRKQLTPTGQERGLQLSLRLLHDNPVQNADVGVLQGSHHLDLYF